MSRLIDISDERFWQILFEEACVEGQQAERIEKELEKIVSFNLDKVVDELEEQSKHWYKMKQEALKFNKGDLVNRYDAFEIALNSAIEIVKRGGVDEHI